MNEAIKAYFFIPKGMRNYLERGFAGWGFVFGIYVLFSGLLAYQSGASVKSSAFIFLQAMMLLFIIALLSVAGAFAIGAKEPLIKGLRLLALCLPPLGLTVFFLAGQSPLIYFIGYMVVLFIFGMALLGPKGKFINGAVGAGTISLAMVLFYLQAEASARWLDRELIFDGYKIQIDEKPTFGQAEIEVYRYILLSTPQIGRIPRSNEIADSLKISTRQVVHALEGLDKKGRIVLGSDGEIRYAFPWAAYDHGYSISVRLSSEGPVLGPVYAASAIDALAASAAFKKGFVKVIGYIRDTDEPLILEISDGKISGCSSPGALVYMSDSFSKIEFYSSISGAKASYHGRFDSTKLLDLERAIQVATKRFNDETAGVFANAPL